MGRETQLAALAADFKTLSEFHQLKLLFILNQLTGYFAVQGIQNKKDRKHLLGSGEIAKKKKDCNTMKHK